jgi:uncharacterized protein
LSSFREKLKALEELQQLDLELNEVRARLQAVPARRAEIDVQRLAVRRAYDDERSRLEGVERERRGVEQLLQLERDKVKKWEGRLGEIKTPREYAALSREIDIAKKANEGSSEQVRELGNQIAEIRTALETREEQLAEGEEKAQAEIQALEKETGEIREKIASLEARRAEATQRVDPGLLGKYENIRRRRAGIAIAPVVGMACKGCHRNIPPQLAIALQRANSIETCPNCHRIIYSAEAVNPPAPSPA